jgi:glucose/arabinose dehydrogenase
VDVVNERDELGSDLVPDYLTSVRDGGFYGWPYSYFGQHVDKRVTPERSDLVAKAIVPDYALGNHTASLGLTFAAGTLLPSDIWTGPSRRASRQAKSGAGALTPLTRAGPTAAQSIE